jgi:hypothetical protein
MPIHVLASATYAALLPRQLLCPPIASISVEWPNRSLDRVFQLTGNVADYAELADYFHACFAESFGPCGRHS